MRQGGGEVDDPSWPVVETAKNHRKEDGLHHTTGKKWGIYGEGGFLRTPLALGHCESLSEESGALSLTSWSEGRQSKSVGRRSTMTWEDNIHIHIHVHVQ